MKETAATKRYVVKQCGSTGQCSKVPDDNMSEEEGIWGGKQLSATEMGELFSSTPSTNTPSTNKKRKKQPNVSTQQEIMEFLQVMDQERRKQHEERERNKDQRSKELQGVLRDLINKM
jgi:hypothetical protein